MNRRRFITGILASATATTALVKLASPGEVAALTLGQEVIVKHPERQELYMPTQLPEIYARRPDGTFVCIGICTSIDVRAHIEDISWSGQAILTPGIKSGQLFFEGRLVE